MSDNDREHTKVVPDSESPTQGDLPQPHALEASLAFSNALPSDIVREKINIPRNIGQYRNLVKIAELRYSKILAGLRKRFTVLKPLGTTSETLADSLKTAGESARRKGRCHDDARNWSRGIF